MSIKVDNAVILAAGLSSRFVPYSLEFPKGLTRVKGELLIERQIEQLLEAQIPQILIVTGYKKEQFAYLEKKYPVKLVENSDFHCRNNHSSIFAVRDYLKNTYICSSDNYFPVNPFHSNEELPFYCAVYSEGFTKEWCIDTDDTQRIQNITIGGSDSWYMLGHVFWNEEFSRAFLNILEQSYEKPWIRNCLWEDLYVKYLSKLPPLYMKCSRPDEIFEFDSLEELRIFDPQCEENNRCHAVSRICRDFSCTASDLHDFIPAENGFSFFYGSQRYDYTV